MSGKIGLIQCLKNLEIEAGTEVNYASAKKAYYKIMTKWHPDKFMNDMIALAKAEEKTKIINASYEELIEILSYNEEGFAAPSYKMNEKDFYKKMNIKGLDKYANEANIDFSSVMKNASKEDPRFSSPMINEKILAKVKVWAKGLDFSDVILFTPSGTLTHKAISNILEVAELYHQSNIRRRFHNFYKQMGVDDDLEEEGGKEDEKLSRSITEWIEKDYVLLPEYGYTHKGEIESKKKALVAKMDVQLSRIGLDDESREKISSKMEEGDFVSAKSMLTRIIDHLSKTIIEDKMPDDVKNLLKLAEKLNLNIEDLADKDPSSLPAHIKLVAPRLADMIKIYREYEERKEILKQSRDNEKRISMIDAIIKLIDKITQI